MSHLNPGLISAYNSLTDKHLTGYFNNTRIRRHLQRVGLITRSGRIVPDKEYRHKLIQRSHQRYVRECLAQAIFHKVLEMERLHQIEIKRKLEEFARRERVHKIKVERSKRYEEDVIHILSPRPPTGPRGVRAQHSGPEGENSESSESPGSSRPNTAPGKMQRPVRLKPIHSNSTTASHRRSSPYRSHESSNETDQPFKCTTDKECRRRVTMTEFPRDISPYRLPVINNFVTPVPPPTKRKDRGPKGTPNRGRRLRPTTAPTAPDITEYQESPMLRTSVLQSGVCLNMVFYGKTVHLSHDMIDMRDEVKVFQQHCGGENLCVYKGKLCEGETFQFVSRRHRGFPFSLTFFLNGLQVERLSSCCEFKHRKGSRLGGRHGHFGFTSVEGASPCYKCIIAMGLDKKPTPPPKRVKEDVGGEATVISPTETTKDAAEMEGEGTATTHPQDMETEVQQDKPPEEDKARDDYEEDFEADDEGPAEDGVVNDKKTHPPSSKREGEDREQDASDSEEDDVDEDRRSRSPSSSSGTDREDSEAETHTKEDQAADGPKEPEEDARQVDREETPVPPAKTDKPTTVDARAAESNSPAPPQTTTSTTAKDSSGAQDSPGDSTGSTELEVSDTSVPSGNEGKGDGDTSGAKEENKEDQTADESPQEEELERAKSVQEKLAEAILKEAQCSSEPELSDTSTEEEEESTDKGQQQDSKDTVPKTSVTIPLQRQTQIEEVKCEESATVADEAVEDQGEETSEEKEKEDETAPDPDESAVKVESDELEKNKEVEKAASELDNKEDTGEKDESEIKEGADMSLHPESEEKLAEDKASEPQEDEPEKSTDAEAAEKELEEEKIPEDLGTNPDETEQDPEETKSIKEDESLTPELRNKTGEMAASDNAEVEEEVTECEVAEMKAEPTAEPEAISCDEAPVTDTEEQGNGEATVGSSNAEVTAENSSSSSEGSGDTTVHAENTVDTSEIKTEDEPAKDDDKEEATKEASRVQANKDEDGQQESVKDNQMSAMGEEENEESVKVNEGEDELEKAKSEEDKVGDEEIKQDGIQEVDNVDDEEKSKKDKTEEEAKDEAEGSMKDVETTGDGAEENGNAGAKAQEGGRGGNLDKGDQIAGEERVEDAEQSVKDEDSKVEDSECVKADGEQLEEKVTTAEEIQEGKEISQSTEEQPEKTAEDEQKKDFTNTSNGNIGSKDTDSDNKAEDESNGATIEDVKTEEIKDNVTEAENVEKESEKDGTNGEKDERDTPGTEVDAENGEKEIATVTQNETQEDEASSTPQDKKDMEGENINKKNTVPGTEELNQIESREGAKDHGETSDQCEDEKLDQSSDTDRVEKESKTEDTNVDIQSESRHGESEPACPVVEVKVVEVKEEANADNSELKEDIKDETEESKDPDENVEPTDSKESAPESEDKDSDMNIKNDDVQNNVNEVTVVSSASQGQSSEHTAKVDNAAHKSDGEKEESNAPSDSEMDKPPNTDTNAADVGPSAVNRETGADTEEASKPSEEGESVVLKPQAESEKDADHPKDSSAEDKEADSLEKSAVTPESLEREDNRDLVKNWVNLHQASKFFEKFVEPLDDLKGSTLNGTANDSNHNTKVIESKNVTEQPRPESPVITLKMSEHKADDGINVENAEKDADPITNYVNESEDNNKVEAILSDLRSNHSKDDDHSESEPTKETLQVKEETEVTHFTPITETEQSGEDDTTRPANEETSSEEHNGTSGISEEDKDKDATIERGPEQNEISKTEVESFADTNHSVASVKHDNVPESPKEEETTKDKTGLNEKQTVDENRDHMSPSKTEDEPQEHVESPENFSNSSPTNMPAGDPEDTKDTSEQKEESMEVTEITDLKTTSKSDDGSQGDSQGVQLQPKQSEGSVSGDNKVELIEDIKHTVSKDQSSTFSVEEVFGRTSFPPLTTAQTESGY